MQKSFAVLRLASQIRKKLIVKLFSFKDIDECTLNQKLCSHECKNTIGSYKCECPAGLELKAGSTCVGMYNHTLNDILSFNHQFV